MTAELPLKTTTTYGVTVWHCPYCWRVTKSKSTINAHINAEHEEEKMADLADIIEESERSQVAA